MAGKQHVIRMLADRCSWSAGFSEGRYAWSIVTNANREDDILQSEIGIEVARPRR